MIELYKNDEECCGCGACEAVCPKKLIQMQINKEGFFYPYISDSNSCINCKKCLSVCPMKQENKQQSLKKNIFAIVTQDDLLWKNSSSGGAFTELCRTFNKEELYIFGAKWEGLDVVMDYVKSAEEISPFNKSKYVEANPNKVFEKVKIFLDEGKSVVFSGTPCQCNGLQFFLNKKYENLFLIDFACHGQGSIKIFHKWIEYLNHYYKNKVVSFCFREKKLIFDHVNSNCCSYTFEDGKKIIKTRDYYHHAYVKGLCMRKSCINCKFADNRVSDITLADFKNLRQGLPHYKGKKNVSTVIVNSEKGEKSFKRLQNVKIFKPDPAFVYKKNPKLKYCRPGNPARDTFIDMVINQDKDIRKCIKKFARINMMELIEYNCPTFVSSFFNLFFYPIKIMNVIIKKIQRKRK